MKNVLIWGWGEGVSKPIVDAIRNNDWRVTWISDSLEADYNIYGIFRGDYRGVGRPETFAEVRRFLESCDFGYFEELFSRHWKAYEYDRHATKNALANYIYFFDSVLKDRKIDGVIFSNLPHEGPDFVLARLVQWRGLPMSVFAQIFISDRIENYRSIDDRSLIPRTFPPSPSQMTFESMLPDKAPWYMTGVSGRWAIFKNCLRTIVRHFGKGILRLKVGDFLRAMEEIRFTQRMMAMGDGFSIPEKFVFFPLHLQPEMTTAVLGGAFADQVLAIEALRIILPNDVAIVLKENPRQTSLQRDEEFFKRIEKIPNCIWAPIQTSSFDLIRRCLFVATITGTPGWESLLRGKPVLVFGDPWYGGAPGVSQYHGDLRFEDLMQTKTDLSSLKAFYEDLVMNRLHPFVSDAAYVAALKNFDPNENGRRIAEHLRKTLFSEKGL